MIVINILNQIFIFKNEWKKYIFHVALTVFLKIDNVLQHGLYHLISMKHSFKVVCMLTKCIYIEKKLHLVKCRHCGMRHINSCLSLIIIIITKEYYNQEI